MQYFCCQELIGINQSHKSSAPKSLAATNACLKNHFLTMLHLWLCKDDVYRLMNTSCKNLWMRIITYIHHISHFFIFSTCQLYYFLVIFILSIVHTYLCVNICLSINHCLRHIWTTSKSGCIAYCKKFHKKLFTISTYIQWIADPWK